MEFDSTSSLKPMNFGFLLFLGDLLFLLVASLPLSLLELSLRWSCNFSSHVFLVLISSKEMSVKSLLSANDDISLSSEEIKSSEKVRTEESESEESLRSDLPEPTLGGRSVGLADNKLDGPSDEEIVVSAVADPQLKQRFKRAYSLLSVGFRDKAKWELYEIERRTKNLTYSSSLVDYKLCFEDFGIIIYSYKI